MAYHKPYNEPGLNTFYNLLFGDDPSLLTEEARAAPPFNLLSAARPDPAALRALAEDEQQESRVRLLAHHCLLQLGERPAQLTLLGVVVEVSQEKGLDTLAAYADGSARYINQIGSPVIIEDRVDLISGYVHQVLEASLGVVGSVKPHRAPRLAPPTQQRVRINFLASDGLRFVEADFDQITKDRRAGPVMEAASNLLERIVDLAGASPA